MSKKEETPGGQTPAPASGQALGQAPGQAPGRTSGLLMYVGPTMLHPVFLKRNRVYTGIPPAVITLDDQDLLNSFVPLAEAGKALRELEGYPGSKPGEHSRRYGRVRKSYLEPARPAGGEVKK